MSEWASHWLPAPQYTCTNRTPRSTSQRASRHRWPNSAVSFRFSPYSSLVFPSSSERSPPPGPAGDLAAALAEHDEPGEVAVLGAEPEDRPRPEARPAGEHRPGVHLADAADVVEAVGLARPQERPVVGAGGHVRDPVAEVAAA